MNIGNETERIEFKKSTSELKEGIVSIASILNKHGGGVLYFGVKDNGEVVGQDVGKTTARDISHAVASNIKPGCWYEISRKDLPNGKSFIEVAFSGSQAPYSAYGRYYQRFADEDRIMGDYELERLFKERLRDYSAWENQDSFEALDAVDEHLLQKLLQNGNELNRVSYDEVDVVSSLKKLGLVHKTSGNLTNAGRVLFSSERPVLAKLAAFASTTKSVFTKLEHFEGNVFECIDRSLEFITQSINWNVSFGESSQRIETPEIPYEALREVVVNAFAHGCYGENTAFEIDVFSDRVSVYSPGNFPRGYTPEDFAYRAEEPVALNPKIVSAMFKVGVIESFGTGFKRTFGVCKEAGIDCRYFNTKSGFRFEFSRPLGQKDVQGMSKTQKAVLKEIVKNPFATGKEIASVVGKSEKTVYRAIRALKDSGHITRKGTDSNGSWEICDGVEIEE